ncbi:hypothetical protein ACWGLC_16240 [Dietzia sp. NPDC055877]
MTSPGGDVPEGAYVGTAGQSNSIGRLSDISEASAKSMMQGAAAPSFNRQRDAAWGVFNDIAYAITGVQVDENGNPITHIQDWATKDLHNLGEVIQDYGSAIEDLGKDRVMPWAVPTVAPLSESLNRRADATFQLQGFMSLANPMTGRAEHAGRQGSDTAYYHDHAVGTYRVDTRLAEGWVEGNRTYLAFITPSVTRLYNGIDFMVGATTGTPAVLDFALFRTDENRQLKSLIGVQRVQPAEVGNGRQVISRTIEPTLVQQGEYIAVAIRQFATGSVRPLLGLYDIDRPLKNSMFPRKITARRNSTDAIPETINGETELDFTADWFIPYIELSEDVGVDYRVFNENWPDVGEARRPWVRLTSVGIRSSGGYTAAGGSGVRVSMYDQPLSTDRVRIRTSVHKVHDSSEPTTIIVRGTSDLRSGIGLQVIPHHDGHSVGRYELISWSNQNPGRDWMTGVTVLHTINVRPQAGHQLEIDYLDGPVTVRINGTEVITEKPVSGQSGAARRFVGIQLERTTVFLAGFPSPHLGPWSARDLPESDGGGEDDEEDEGPIVGE